jgi:hypothetical protein
MHPNAAFGNCISEAKGNMEKFSHVCCCLFQNCKLFFRKYRKTNRNAFPPHYVKTCTLVQAHWGSVQSLRPIGGVEVQLYPFMTTALKGDEGSASRPGHSLPLGKTRYPLYRMVGGPQGRSGQLRKISPPPRFDPRTVQPVANHYTDWATRPVPHYVMTT